MFFALRANLSHSLLLVLTSTNKSLMSFDRFFCRYSFENIGTTLFGSIIKFLLLFLLQFQQILLDFQKLREFRGGFLKLSVVGMREQGKAATLRYL